MFTQSDEFKGVRIKLASPDTILGWSHGEVTKPETINYRTQRPEKDGLFDEKIFGPIKDWECYCGKYKRIRYKGIVCDKCGVEVTRAAVRRERMGHIKLAVPVAHIWFLRGVPSRIGSILNLSVQDLEKVFYFAAYIITNVNEESRNNTLEQIESEFKMKKKEIEAKYEALISKAKQFKDSKKDAELVAAGIDAEVTRLQEAWKKEAENLDAIRDQARSELKTIKKMQIISELEYRDLSLKYGPVFVAGIGAEAVKGLLEDINMEELARQLDSELVETDGMARRKMLKRLKLVKSMITAGLRPEWTLISYLPVIPPDLRPMVQLDGGRFAASDLNDLYRRVINRNNRLKKLLEIKAPEVITRNEKRMLQEAVDALIDNSIRHGKEVTASTGQKRKLRSLADMLKGKQGRFRQNLLGKRVDYSGRSVIVVGPHLKLHQCGLPKKMALELFKPFVISKLIGREYAHNVRSANKLIEQGKSEVYDILEEVTQGHYVLLNRAPTLHRLGFQAFQPVLIEGKAIQLHPMVCAAFNADFDGDQMAIHVPLTDAAQKEAREIMVSSHNLLKPASGDPVMTPDKDVVVGSYYITKTREGMLGEGKAFSSPDEALLAYNMGYIHVKAIIKVKMLGQVMETSVGRVIFNQILPPELGYRNETFDKKKLQALVREAHKLLGNDKTAELIDRIKSTGFNYATKSGLSWGMDDLKIPEIKKELLAAADIEVETTYQHFREGLLTEHERYSQVIEIWSKVLEEMSKNVTSSVDPNGSVNSMVVSGARGSFSQVSQMAGMKGLVVNPAGDVIELPVKGSFKEGLTVLEYFISTHGSRKGMSDTALRTADAGYLTRRLVDVAQDIVVNSEDCGTLDYIDVTRAMAEQMNKGFDRRLFGRVAAEDIKDNDGKVLVKKNEGLDEHISKLIGAADSGIDSVKCRSVLKCKLVRGVCRLCYGYDLGFNEMVKLGAAVGIVAAQAIGEPGTQLTMRTFHTGGVAGVDITQGLPRVEELFEAREPKGQATVSDIDGTAYISKPNNKEYLVRIQSEGAEKDEYTLDEAQTQLKDGDKVTENEALFINGAGKAVKAKAAGIVHMQNNKIIVVRESDEHVREYTIPTSFSLSIKDHDLVTKGQQMTEGNLNLGQILGLRGTQDAQNYIVKEVQDIYVSQGQNIHDKHVEVIVRQMFSKMRILEAGDSEFLVGDLIDKARLNDTNEKLVADGRKAAQAEQLLMGITKVSLNTESFLAAASFQETTRVLIEAALAAKTDTLRGLKENVIIGKLIPAGTGFNPVVAEELIDADLKAPGQDEVEA
ncbi:MAG: DNA-directed polymerase subunit beta, DNA-directed polymerase subunit beta [Candidatus Doudnabacteria bacterium]|nr:DNA-directed polymerase subunit beta, DNA-directed polymerase subunit beta [Candidatus Doudnabacteria bacterium]